jgi:hypothetical protein
MARAPSIAGARWMPCAIFVGTFTLEAARAVAPADGIDADQGVDVVVKLVAKSLVAADITGPSAR